MKITVCDICILESKKLTPAGWTTNVKAATGTIKYHTCSNHRKAWSGTAAHALLDLLYQVERKMYEMTAAQQGGRS